MTIGVEAGPVGPVSSAPAPGATCEAVAAEAVQEAPAFTVSAKALIAFSAKQGDLMPGHTPGPTAQEGQEVHRLIAQRRAEGHESEVSVTGRFQQLRIQGRIDVLDLAHARIEEIKSHYGEADDIAPFKRRLDWAQLELYGALLCQQERLAQVELALVYVQVGSLKERAEVRRCTADQLAALLRSWALPYLQWAQAEGAHRQARDRALRHLRFPYPTIGAEQMMLMQGVVEAITGNQLLLAEGPTGVGKTLGVLFPALRRMPRNRLDKLVYTTAKNTGRREALKGLRQLLQPPADPKDMASAVPLRVLELSAQERLCLQAPQVMQAPGGAPSPTPGRVCHGAVCPYAQGFYDKLPQARVQAVQQQWLDQPALVQIGRDHQICPYFLSQELVRWADVVVTDYHQVFSDHALITPMVAENRWRVTALVDEAHNLSDRTQAMFSAELALADVWVARHAAPRSLQSALDAWEQAWQVLLARLNRTESAQASRQAAPSPADQGAHQETLDAAIDEARWWKLHAPTPSGGAHPLGEAWKFELQKLNTALGAYFSEDPKRAQGPLLRFWFKCLRFASLLDGCEDHVLIEMDTRVGSLQHALRQLDPHAVTHGQPGAGLFHDVPCAEDGPLPARGSGEAGWGEPAQDGRHRGSAMPRRTDAGVLRLVDHLPAKRLQGVWGVYASWVVFSATLPPVDGFVDLLGVSPDCLRLEVPSPFKADQLRVSVWPISTRYADRPATIGRIVRGLLDQMARWPGNYLAFWSSFDYLALAQAELHRQAPGWPLWVQRPAMSEGDRQAFVARFVPGGQGLGMAVLGGVFGEGVDLPGDRLVGAFVVSVGHPKMDDRLDAIVQLRANKLGPEKAREYTLVQPGMQKVVQAAGRVIRTLEDRGAVTLVDHRFGQRRYRERLPKWWWGPAPAKASP